MDIKDKGNQFDPAAWQRAYNGAELSPATKRIKAIIEEETGNPVMTISEAVEHQNALNANQLNLIHAELGEDTYVRLTGESGVDKWDLTENQYCWSSLVGFARAYRIRGDENSVDKILSVFPENSKLREQIEKQLSKVKADADYSGYDSVRHIGKLVTIELGNRFDLNPGIVDFREYVDGDQLDIEAISTEIARRLGELETVYVEDELEVNSTLRNVGKAFGEEVMERLWVEAKRKFHHIEKGN